MEEITPVATTNGVATNSEETASEAQNVWEANSAAEEEKVEEAAAEAEEEAAAAVVVYMEEGNAAAHAEPLVVEVDAEGDEEMGEAEYLEDESPEDECEDERVLAEGDKNNAEKEQAKGAEGDDVAAVATAEKEAVAEEGTPTAEEDVELEAEGEADADDDAEAEDGEDEDEDDDEDDEGELITGDDAAQADHREAGDTTQEANVSARSGARSQEEQVDENQCRVCTSKEQLVSLFTKTSEGTTPADMLLFICPSVSIALKDFMPQFICSSCLESLTIAIKLRKQLETTDRELRKRLSRSKNKVRRPRGYVVIDAPVSESASDDEEELNDDVEFKMSDVAGSTSADSDSADTDISEKRKPGRRRGRKKGMKRSAASSNSYEDDHYRKKSHLSTPASAAASQGPFECDQCDLSFPRKQSYVMHRKMHDSRHEFHCQICNKKFKVRGAYKTHMERHAAERAQFRCELCAQVFRLRAELKRHMAISHDEHGIIYECKRCQRTFLTQTRLQRHQSTNCSRHSEQKVKQHDIEGQPRQGRDLFKSVAPLTTTYWSDSFSD